MTVHHRPLVTRAAEGLDRRRFTVAEVERMVASGLMADERNELIGGELVPMSPKGLPHEKLKVALLDRWYQLPVDAVELAVATTFRLAVDTYLEPDILVFDCPMGLSSAFETLSSTTALLVVEIADSSLRYDIGRKAALYASFGVRELWVIDAVKLITRVFREPSAGGYCEMREVGAHEAATPLVAPEAFVLRLAELGIE